MTASNATSARVTPPARALAFDDFYRLLDAVMLFGGALAMGKGGSDQVTLSLCRTREQWPVLAWAVILLETHGIPMRLSVGAGTIRTKLGYKSPANTFFNPTLRRWYPKRSAKGCGPASTPDDLVLCEAMLAVCLADALARHRDGDVRLSAPRLTGGVAAALAGQANGLGVEAVPVTTARYHGLCVPAAQRGRVERWLARFVPRNVWDGCGRSEDAQEGDDDACA